MQKTAADYSSISPRHRKIAEVIAVRMLNREAKIDAMLKEKENAATDIESGQIEEMLQEYEQNQLSWSDGFLEAVRIIEGETVFRWLRNCEGMNSANLSPQELTDNFLEYYIDYVIHKDQF